MTYDLDALRRHIPYYLTAGHKALIGELDQFFADGGINYYIDRYPEEILQGDGWRGLELIHFESGERRAVSGILLSNTCDVDPENARVFPRRITFAPIVKISTLERILGEEGVPSERIASKVDAVRKQLVTSMFFLPAGGPLEEDYCARLDDLYVVPAITHEQNPDRAKLFTLSQVGHYLFLFKLSIHFCRFQEEVLRTPSAD